MPYSSDTLFATICIIIQPLMNDCTTIWPFIRCTIYRTTTCSPWCTMLFFFFICSTVQTHYRCLKIVRCKNPMVLLYGHGQRGRQTQVSYSFVLFVFWYSRCDWFKLPCLGWVNPKKLVMHHFRSRPTPKYHTFCPSNWLVIVFRHCECAVAKVGLFTNIAGWSSIHFQ